MGLLKNHSGFFLTLIFSVIHLRKRSSKFGFRWHVPKSHECVWIGYEIPAEVINIESIVFKTLSVNAQYNACYTVAKRCLIALSLVKQLPPIAGRSHIMVECTKSPVLFTDSFNQWQKFRIIQWGEIRIYCDLVI